MPEMATRLDASSGATRSTAGDVPQARGGGMSPALDPRNHSPGGPVNHKSPRAKLELLRVSSARDRFVRSVDLGLAGEAQSTLCPLIEGGATQPDHPCRGG
jgi:hypothetical protein